MTKEDKPNFSWNDAIRKLSGLDGNCPICNSDNIVLGYQDFESGYKQFTCAECGYTWEE